jgi:hypothetical protein
MNLKTFNIICILIAGVIFKGCGVYSLSGIAIDYSKIQTISIENFYDESAGGPPNLAQRFSEQLRDYYQQNTQLDLSDLDGHLQLQGSISDYRLTPVAPTASDNPNMPDIAQAQRLTITVAVSYTNIVEPEQSFENRRFSFYSDYNPDTQQLSQVENDLIETIFTQIVYDIFNATVANW